MDRSIEATDVVEEEEPEPVAVPRPRANGSYSVESLGRFVDRLMGSDRRHARAAAELEHLWAKDEEPDSDPEPVEVPTARPGGTEAINRGVDPDAERR